jgi:hypothetical protein
VSIKRTFLAARGEAEEHMEAVPLEHMPGAMLVMDMGVDEGALVECAGRELVNRFQKLKKHCGVCAADKLLLAFQVLQAPEDTESDKGRGADSVRAVLGAQADAIRTALDCALEELPCMEQQGLDDGARVLEALCGATGCQGALVGDQVQEVSIMRVPVKLRLLIVKLEAL